MCCVARVTCLVWYNAANIELHNSTFPVSLLCGGTLSIHVDQHTVYNSRYGMCDSMRYVQYDREEIIQTES